MLAAHNMTVNIMMTDYQLDNAKKQQSYKNFKQEAKLSLG